MYFKVFPSLSLPGDYLASFPKFPSLTSGQKKPSHDVGCGSLEEYRNVRKQQVLLQCIFPHCFPSLSKRLKGLLDREKEELAEAEVIKDSPDSPEPPNKKPLITMDEMPVVEKAKGKTEGL